MDINSSSEDTARLFIGIPIPDKARGPLSEGIKDYSEHIVRNITPYNWHVTISFLGGSIKDHEKYIEPLSKPLPQSFLPTVTVTHMGRGLKPNLLWAYIDKTPNLNRIREDLISRLTEINMPLPKDINRDFIPHITLADFSKEAHNTAIADCPINVTWPIKEAILYRSISTETGVQYKPLSSIPFTK